MKNEDRLAGNDDPFARKGAVEGDRPDDAQHFNANADVLDENGLPRDIDAMCEDVIGANVDQDAREAGVAGAAVDATETGATPQQTPRNRDGKRR